MRERLEMFCPPTSASPPWLSAASLRSSYSAAFPVRPTRVHVLVIEHLEHLSCQHMQTH